MPYVKQRTIIENSFFIWLNLVVLILTAIPTHYYFRGSWSIQKNYEIVSYVIGILCCALITLINTHSPKLSQPLIRYKLYMLLYMPLAVVLYSFLMPEWVKFSVVFMLSLLGMSIFSYDLLRPMKTESQFFPKAFSYSKALMISVITAIFVILWRSQGNSFHIKSWELVFLIGFIFIFLNFKSIKTNYYYWIVPLLLFVVTYLSMDGIIDYGNASFILGPVSEFLYSHQHPLTISAQYGSGLTLFVALYYQLIGLFYLDGLAYLLKACMFIEYLLVYAIAFKLLRSHKIAFLCLLSVLIFNFYSMMTIYYSFPQIGFIRFGLIYLIILCYIFEHTLPQRLFYVLVSTLASIAAIWSFESAVYVIPAVLFAEYINKNLRQFLPVFITCFATILFVYLFPLIQQGQWHSLSRYYEYANLYAVNSEDFFSLPLSRSTSFWWLYPVLYAFLLIQILSGKINDKIVILLTVYGLATFTYFGGRAHPNNLCIISIPFILLSVYSILHIQHISSAKKNLLLSLFFGTFGVANYAITDFGNGVNANGLMVIKGIYSQNLPLLKKSILPESPQAKINVFKQNCTKYAVFNKYIENHSLAILEYDLLGAPGASDIRLVDYYGCSHAHNAFGVNPYLATTINRKAMDRVVIGLTNLHNQYVLIDSRLLDKDKNLPSSAIPMVEEILKALHANKVDQFELENTTFIVFKNNRVEKG